MDFLRFGLLVAGVVCVATGLLPVDEAGASLSRIAPLLLFLTAVIVLAELAREARVFDVVAVRLAVLGRGFTWALFLLCVAFAATTTVVLNLDTTAVLLTPVFLALSVRIGISALPLAMTTLWLANTASLLLPVSNLTNLLAAERVAADPFAFAGRMWLPQVVAVAVTTVVLWVCHWRRESVRYTVPAPVVLVGRERALFRWNAGACVLFVVAIPVLRSEVEWAALGAASVAVGAFLVHDRRRLGFGLFPWRLLVFVSGLFLVVPTVSRYGLSDALAVIGSGDPLRTAAVSAGLANLINNLPAYAAVEAVVPAADLPAVLIGTNVGAVVTPWASLATLLCLEFCRAHGVRVRVWRLVGEGLVLASVAVTACALVL
ncbi:ArsB/NhaD family transporter [Saccharothrix violaceirubra]|uniref:Arsenical pump membrane protein n=1 Tax=Saccharothrix violaceirubra TaxID=413306 RepID=A0A7W7WTJ4_9PSEU|nr:SLC13 family permease [Saccharothrix violaceirubra]MBB4963245.1 arsenical pump membrane protein [Saccharothrix violaceirubra]